MLEDGEVFDSSLLKETINKLIAIGKRNFALDLSSLDYIYSDTINALMALNKRTLDVSGRLSLLAPQEEVLQILKRAGIHNILRIFETEADLVKTSEDIILQTTSIQLGDIQAITQQEEPQKPQSEFDQLRSEIGSVFGSSGDHEDVLPPPPKTKTISGSMRKEPVYAPPPPPPAPVVNSSIEQEFNDAFRQFESDTDQGHGFIPPPPPSGQYRMAPPPPQYTPPPPQSRPGFNQQPQFQNRQMPPQAPVQPTRPAMPPVPPAHSYDSAPQKPPTNTFIPSEIPNNSGSDFQSPVRETQRYQPPASARPVPQQKIEPAFTEAETFEDFDTSSKKKPSKPLTHDDSFDESEDDFMDDVTAKKSPLPMVLIIVLIVILGGAGAYFGLGKFMKSGTAEKTPPVAQATVPTPPAPPQVPVEPATPAPGPVAPVAPEPVVEAPKVEKPAPVVERVKRDRPVVTPRPKPEPVRAARPEPVVEQPKVASKLLFTSNPSGAKVTINGDYAGMTPYTWDNPVFGAVSVIVSKSGYEDQSRVFEFTGGSSKENFILQKAAPTPPPQPVAKTPDPEPEPSYFEPEPEPVSKPAPEPTPAPVSQPVASAGGDASIFIASIPPVADVYLDGKLIGKTNVSEIKLPTGTHTLRFVKGPKETTKVVTVQSGKNPSQMVRLP